MGSRRHRKPNLLNSEGQGRCQASGCTFAGTSDEIDAHIRYRVTVAPNGTWIGPANTTAASLGDLLSQLGLASA